MPNLKIFISSTCYDLSIVRSSLRTYIISMGYEPVMSEFSDILYDPRSHTHNNCIQEVKNCDILILIIGSRFGGKAIPEAINEIDFERLVKKSYDPSILKDKYTLSITQLEVLKAIELSIPVYTIIDRKVLHDYYVYEENKGKNILNEIIFPSLQKPETYKYIFEFINFLKNRVDNNCIADYSTIEEIENFLKKQWALLFQKLLSEEFKGDLIFEDSETIINKHLKSIKPELPEDDNKELKQSAEGVIKFQNLINFIIELSFHYKKELNIEFINSQLLSNYSWDTLLNKCGILYMRKISKGTIYTINNVALIKKDKTFYLVRVPHDFERTIILDWEIFKEIDEKLKYVIIDAILECLYPKKITFKYINEEFSNNLFSS